MILFWRKLTFYPFILYHLQITFWLEIGLYVHFLFWVLGFCLVWNCACCQNLRFYAIIRPVTSVKMLVPWTHLLPIHFSFFTSFFMKILDPWNMCLLCVCCVWGGLMKRSYLYINGPESYALRIVQSWISLLITIYCQKKLLWWALRDSLSYGHHNILFFCSFNEIIVGFSIIQWLI